jgi:uncharacterized protein (TIGR03067 family)
MARQVVLLVLLVGLGLAARDTSSASGEQGDSFKKELKALEGNWRLTRFESKGRVRPANLIIGDRYVIEEDKLQSYWGDTNKGDAATIVKIDGKANPKTIDVTHTYGSSRGKTQLGIYKIEKDKFEVAWGEPGATKRPTKFTSKPGVGSAHEYRVYEREKD